MAEETVVQEPAGDPNDIGLFISTVATGYVEPAIDKVRAIETAIHSLILPNVSRQILKDLMTIKLLAPEESKDLVICNIPQVAAFIHQIRTVLVRRYHEGA